MTATASLSITVVSPPSTTVTFDQTAVTVTAPVPAGYVLANITVAPTGWTGSLSLTQTGPQAGALALSGNALVVGTSPLTQAGAYSASVTATP
jgi:hypothetical protein